MSGRKNYWFRNITDFWIKQLIAEKSKKKINWFLSVDILPYCNLTDFMIYEEH